jgi:nucleoid-associated protein YgaU
MKITAYCFLMTILLASCSGSKSHQSMDENSPEVELTDVEEMDQEENSELNADDEKVDIAEQGIESDVDEKAVEVLDESVANDEEIEINNELSPTEELTSSSAQSLYSGGGQKEYVVQKNETLMLIAFKLYGDYSRWRSLATQNPGKVDGSGLVRAGSILSYEAPVEEFVWSPSGNPYLIKNGDTLGTISKQVYETTSKWKMIWENNRPMIKDPNKIYAGFTIYYVDGREVASEI